MRPTRRSHPSAAARRQRAELLRTLRVICVNLRGLQTSASAAAIYRDVEDFLGREIARLRAPRVRGARARPSGSATPAP